MSANNHPERFASDSYLTERNNRVLSLIHKYKTEPHWTARPTYLMMPYDKITGVVVLGAVAVGAFQLTRLVKLMFTQGIATNGHPSERQ
jgi:hypothetical protein